MPTDNPVPAQFALESALEGMSANAGLRAFREAGGHVANATWYRLRGEVESFISAREGIYSEPTNLKPVAGEIQRWTTNKARGFVQQVEVLVRERESGTIISVPYTSMGRDLRSRQRVIAQALDIYSDDNAKKYNQQVLGAIYTGTYEAVPIGE